MDAKDYIERASSLEVGEELYIPMHNKKMQQKSCTIINNTGEEYSRFIDQSCKFRIYKTFKDSRLWVVIEKLPETEVIFKKAQGEIKKIKLIPDSLKRILGQMKEDGKTVEEMETFINRYMEEG